MPTETLPVVFRKTPPSTTAYDWADSTLNVGYRTYYGACSIAQGDTQSYFLASRSNIESITGDSALSGIYTTITGTGSTQTCLTFDITIQKACDIAAATAFVNMTWYASSNDRTCYCTYTINHYDGSTVTQLGTYTCQEPAAAVAKYYRDLAKISCTAKHFAAGDIIRVIVKAVITNTKTILMYHDPSSSLTFTDLANRTIGTDFVVTIPFKIDL